MNYKAGWYASGCNADPSDLWGTDAEPDQIWINQDDAGHTTWGYNCVADAKWNDLGDRRIGQFQVQKHDTISGSGPFEVDYDCLNGRENVDEQDDNMNDPNEEPNTIHHQDTEDPNCDDWFTPG